MELPNWPGLLQEYQGLGAVKLLVSAFEILSKLDGPRQLAEFYFVKAIQTKFPLSQLQSVTLFRWFINPVSLFFFTKLKKLWRKVVVF